MRLLLMGLMICFMATTSAYSQTRDLDSFSKLRVSGGIKVTLIKSSDSKADIDMQRGDYDDLITEVKGDVLTIKFKSKMLNWGNNNGKADIDLYFSTLESIDASAGSTIRGEDRIVTNEMDIDVSSGSTVSVEVETKDLTVDVSSGATCSLSGSTDDQEVDVSSGATYRGREMASKYTNVDVSSGATATVWATERLVADASSGATVRYKGNPKKKELDSGKWSGGSIKQLGGE